MLQQYLYIVYLTHIGDKKVNVIKVVRAVTGLGLKEAKGLVDAVNPDLGHNSIILDGAGWEDAQRAQKAFNDIGAKANVFEIANPDYVPPPRKWWHYF